MGSLLWPLLFALACVKPAVPAQPVVLPSVPRPAIIERSEPQKPLPPCRLVVPLEADLGSYEAMLGEVLRESIVLSQDDWTLVSAPKDALEVETQIEARIGAPALRMQDNTAIVQIPVQYWGKLRAQARTRFGRIWLTKGTNWGSEKNPGRIMVGIAVKPLVDEYFRLRTKSKLVSIKLKAPKFAKLCTSGRVRVCLLGRTAEKLVHTQIERRIRESSPGFLASLDGRVQQEADLRGALETAARVLGQPAGNDRLALGIERLSLAPVRGSGRSVRLDVELTFRASFGSTKSQFRPVPKRSSLSKQPGFLAFDTDVSFRELTALLGQIAPRLSDGALAVNHLEVLGAAEQGEGLVVALSSVIESHTFLLYLVARPTTDEGYLRFADTRATEKTAQLLAAFGLDAGALAERFEESARVPLRPFADRKVASLQNRLALLTLAFAAVTLEFVKPEFGKVSYRPAGLRVRVEGEGRASVAEPTQHTVSAHSPSASMAP
jgi:hypothetical protein